MKERLSQLHREGAIPYKHIGAVTLILILGVGLGFAAIPRTVSPAIQLAPAAPVSQPENVKTEMRALNNFMDGAPVQPPAPAIQDDYESSGYYIQNSMPIPDLSRKKPRNVFGRVFDQRPRQAPTFTKEIDGIPQSHLNAANDLLRLLNVEKKAAGIQEAYVREFMRQFPMNEERLALSQDFLRARGQSDDTYIELVKFVAKNLSYSQIRNMIGFLQSETGELYLNFVPKIQERASQLAVDGLKPHWSELAKASRRLSWNPTSRGIPGDRLPDIGRKNLEKLRRE